MSRPHMSRPQIPTPLEELGNRPFSFYPAIWNVGHNEWTLRRTAWDEFLVANTKTHTELWMPRRFVSGVSSSEEPVVIVGLRKELEWREGALAPRVQRVIEMPLAVNLAVNDVPRWSAAEPVPGTLAPVVGIRVEEASVTRPVPRKLMARAAAGVLVCVVGLVAFRDFPGVAHGRYLTGLTPRIPLPLTASDNYETVVGYFGEPLSTRSYQPAPGQVFQFLRYPDQNLLIVLAGAPREHAHYMGAYGPGRRVVHSVRLPSGEDSAALLSRLRF